MEDLLIFWDIDGVLRTYDIKDFQEPYNEYASNSFMLKEECFYRAIRAINKANTKFKVHNILCSSWRLIDDLREAVEQKFKEQGYDLDHTISVNPSTYSSYIPYPLILWDTADNESVERLDRIPQRGIEVALYRANMYPKSKYVIIDDEPCDYHPEQQPFIVKTKSTTGFDVFAFNDFIAIIGI